MPNWLLVPELTTFNTPVSLTFAAKKVFMKLSHLSETLIGSEIVKPGGEIRENPVKQVHLYIREFKPLSDY